VRPDGRLDANTPLDTIVDHLRYLVDRLGENNIAFGSDFDGAVMPWVIGDAGGLQRLMGGLRGRGFDEAVLRKLGMGNWLRVFRETWRRG
jgi:membrane dipeptidase